MKLQIFLERFDRFADAPDAARKMRELVLDLAVQGRLTKPEPFDGDGHALLEKLKTLPLERNSKSRWPKAIPVRPETPLDIPSHWALTTVENTTRETGFFGDGDWVESKDQDPAGEVRLIQLADVGDGKYRDRSSRFMTAEAARRLNCSYLQVGDILVARMPDPLGRSCRFPGDSKPAVTVVDVCILRPNVTFFDPDFLVVAINCPRFRRLVLAQATGTTRRRISRSNFGVLPVPLPPLAEQKRIVAKVAELMALCDRLEEQQQERETRHAVLARAALARFASAPIRANVEFLFHPSYAIPPADLRKSILMLAVEGKLVPQCPEDEPASRLAEAIAADREAFLRKRSLTRQRTLGPVADEQGRPFNIPNSWCWQRLGNLCRVQAGFAFEASAFVQGDGGVPLIRIRDIMNHFTQVNLLGEYRDEFLVEPGDYLVGMDGNFTIAKWKGPQALLNQRVSRLQWYSERLEPSFFAVAAQHRLAELQGKKAYTTVDHLSSRQIEDALVPLPPLNEQRRIVAKVDQLMALVDQLESQLGASHSAAENLLEAAVRELTNAQICGTLSTQPDVLVQRAAHVSP